MEINEKVNALRKEMKKEGLKAWIINGKDPHRSEYVSSRWQTRAFISGFTGSEGTVVITEDKALIWVDSRYFIQCADQIKGTVFEMKKLDGPNCSSPLDFLVSTFKNNEKIGISAETLMIAQKRNYEEKNLNIIAEDDILNTIWSDRPSMPDYPIVSLDKEITGATIEEKVNKIRMLGQKNKEDVFLLTALDDIAWTLNLRGQDIENTPVFMAYLVISKDSVDLFTPKARFSNVIPQGYNVHEYDEISSFLENLNNVKVRLDPETTNMLLFNSINKGNNVTISEGRSYATDLKACKNEVELDGIRVAHVLDGVAMVNFLAMVKRKDYDFTELSIAQALEDERSCEEEYLGPSFSTIAGFGSHGAIVHYSATEETDVPLTGNGLLVLDSGGQYTGGTTDITRTLLFGEATQEQKDDYTMVLKGHLALCSQVFPEGTTGHQLDVLAHQFLWQKGMDYYHGTGHGVGHRLSVHEGPMRISSKAGKEQIPLKEGMVISDEPGLYKENSHGIRIENLIAVTKAMETEFGKFLTFEVLTCCPYERELINKDLLTEEEISMVDSYHSWVYETLKDMVEETSLSYLEEATKAL